MQNIKNKLILCILGNLLSLALVLGAVLLCDRSGTYWNIGPNENLVVISIHVNTAGKYVGLLFLILFVNVMKVLSEEIGMPILGFNIYNPDKKIITEFTKNELQLYGNSMFMISAIRGIFMTLFIVSQIDIAFWSVIIREIASFFTIRMILNEKQFVKLTPGMELEVVVVE